MRQLLEWLGRLIRSPWQRSAAKEKTIVILITAIEGITSRRYRHALKSVIKFNATLNDVEDYLHKMIEKHVHLVKRR